MIRFALAAAAAISLAADVSAAPLFEFVDNEDGAGVFQVSPDPSLFISPAGGSIAFEIDILNVLSGGIVGASVSSDFPVVLPGGSLSFSSSALSASYGSNLFTTADPVDMVSVNFGGSALFEYTADIFQAGRRFSFAGVGAVTDGPVVEPPTDDRVTGARFTPVPIPAGIIDPPLSFDNLVTTDISVDFDGVLSGQQLLVELDTGEVFNHPFGSNTAPNEAFIPFFPGLPYDTFVTIGGSTSGTSESTLVVGGAVNIGGAPPASFGPDTLNVTWAPSPGVVVEDETDYLVSRVTLTDNATGRWTLFSNVLGPDVPLVMSGRIVNGSFIPEPSTIVLAGVAASVSRRRRR